MNKVYFVSEVKKLSEDLLLIRLKPEDGKIEEYSPGKFFNLTYKGITRPYSVASSPDQKYLEFCIKLVGGKFTSQIAEVKPGETIEVKGPFGAFEYNPEKPLVLVSGGVGITPMISILRYAPKDQKISLVYSARSLEEMPYYKEILKLSETKNIRFYPTLTRQVPEDWKGHRGRINKELLEKAWIDGAVLFACGPAPLVDMVRLTTVDWKYSESHFEGWNI